MALGVGLRFLDKLGRFVGGGSQHNRVVAALTHFLTTVETENHGSFAEQRMGLLEDSLFLGKPLVETTGDETTHLQVGNLIFAHRHQVGFTEKNVGGLVNRIGVHSSVDLLETGRLNLFFDGGVAVQLGHGHQSEEGEKKLIQFGDVAVRENDASLGVETRRQIIQGELPNVGGDILKSIPVGQNLIVGNDDIDRDSEILQSHPVVERTEKMSDMEGSGGPVAGQNPKFLGVNFQLRFDFLAPCQCCGVSI